MSMITPDAIINAWRLPRFSRKYLFAPAKTSNPKSHVQSMSSNTGSTPPAIAKMRLANTPATASTLKVNWIHTYFQIYFSLKKSSEVFVCLSVLTFLIFSLSGAVKRD